MNQLNEKEENQFQRTLVCKLCSMRFNMHNRVFKVRNHSHFTGKYRRALYLEIRISLNDILYDILILTFFISIFHE